LEDITSGQIVESSIEENQWDYYRISISGGKLTVTVTPTSTGVSDCDLFIKYNTLPSPFDYDARDTGWGSNAVVTLPMAMAGKYYIGVYGSTFKCNYRMVAISDKVDCLGGCFNGGVCVTVAGGDKRCQCTGSWVGDNCQLYLNPAHINLDINYQGIMAPASKSGDSYFTYFLANIPIHYNKLSLMVNFTSTSQCTFLVKHNTLPTEDDNQYAVAPKPSFILSLENVDMGNWFFGVFGPSLCSFDLLLSAVAESCIGSCSDRGTCGPPCSCNPGFTGDYCQTKTDSMILQEKVDGYVDSNLLNWYKYQANTNDYVVVHLNQQSGDCDLYVRADQQPTPTVFDEADITKDANIELYVPDALQSVLYIAVYGYAACRYSIYITLEPKSSDCMGGVTCLHGTCAKNNTCDCSVGWVGSQCDVAATPLNSGSALTNEVINNPNEWKYYSFTLAHPTFLVSIREVVDPADPRAKLSLYLSEFVVPTLTSSNYHNSNPTYPYHTLTLSFDEHPATDFPLSLVIGVYGSPLITKPVNFKIVAWEPDF